MLLVMIDPLIVRLVRRRRVARITQHALARALQCSRSSLSMWEEGRREPPLFMLRKWAEMLDAPLDLVELDEDGDSERDPQIPGQLRTAAQRRDRVLELAARGKHIGQIAAEMGVSERTVHRHRAGARRRDAA